jgi:WD40 repeat protein
LDEAAAKLSVSADVFVLKVEQNPYLVLNSYDNQVIAIVVTPDGKRLVSAGLRIRTDNKLDLRYHDKSIIEIWDLNTGEQLHSIEDDTLISSLTITPDGKRIISGYEDGTIKIWGVPIFHEGM